MLAVRVYVNPGSDPSFASEDSVVYREQFRVLFLGRSPTVGVTPDDSTFDLRKRVRPPLTKTLFRMCTSDLGPLNLQECDAVEHHGAGELTLERLDGNKTSPALFRRSRILRMDLDEESILTVAEIVRDAAAMNDAALAGDMDEARFRVQLIAAKADAAGCLNLLLAAAHLAQLLGSLGTTPLPGYGAGMLRIANVLDRIGFARL